MLMAARRKSFTTSNIYSGFWYTGLISVDRSIILRKIEPSPTLPTVLDPTENPTEHASEYSPQAVQSIVENNSTTQLITYFTIPEINNLQISSTS